MRASTAFLAGIGTVGVAIAGGLGGGLWIAKVMNPHASKYGLEAATFDRRELPASAPLPYVGATLAFMAPGVDGRAPARDQRADGGNAAPRPAEAKASTDQLAKPADTAAVKQPSQDAQAAAKPASSPEDAYAKARDSDLKRQADRRRAERAQRWASRHRHDQPNQQSQQDQGNSDQQASTDSEGSSRNDSGGRYSQRHYSYRGYRDNRPRYRDVERRYPDDREQRYYVEDPPPPPVDLPQAELLGPDD